MSLMSLSSVEEKSIREKPAFEFKDAFLMLLLGAAIGIGLNLVFSAMGITQSSETFEKVAQAQFSRPFWEGLLLYGLVAPVLEEVVFRKGIYGIFRRFASFTVAMVVSAALFGIYHGNVVQGLYGFLMGLVLAVSYEEYQNLLAPILFHGGANLAVYALMYIKI